MAQIDADAVVERSRFLPTVDLVYALERVEYDESDRGADAPAGEAAESAIVGRADRRDDATSVDWSQRILEFGKEPESVRRLRTDQREALYAYEEALRDLISQVRTQYFSLRLKQEQLELRQEILANFQERYESKRSQLEDGKWVDRTTLLQAELNVRSEERRIISVERELVRAKIRLGRLLSLERPEGLEIAGDEMPDLEAPIETLVAVAADRSTEVARQREEVWERERALQRQYWEFAPDLTFETGVAEGDAEALVALRNDSDTWGLDLESRNQLEGPDTTEFRELEPFPGFEEDPAWFARVRLRLPLFEGWARRGRATKAREQLREEESKLESVLDKAEAEAREAWQQVTELQLLTENSEAIARNSGETLRLKQLIQDTLPERVTDNEIETFRERFFRDQDAFFADQDGLIAARENLRRLAGWFE